jgi:hypothetical protein
MKADVDAQRLRKSAAEGECDDLCIFEGDKIVWVKKGNAAADSKVHIGDLPYEASKKPNKISPHAKNRAMMQLTVI